MPLSPKKQMQQIIEQSISMNDLHTAYEALIIYRKTFANDDLQMHISFCYMITVLRFLLSHLIAAMT